MKVFVLTMLAIIGLATTATAKTPESLSIRAGHTKTADHGKVSVKFLSVVEDSRCPVNAKCVWAGNAKVKVLVSKGKGQSKTVEINNGLDPRVVTLYGYEFRLADLLPYPGLPVKSGGTMAAKPTTAVISVTKIKG